MKKREFKLFQVDAFTRTPFEGNAVGVVLDADRLSVAQMQAIARELNNSETAFLLKPDEADHDVQIRFFTPELEVPTCGHATIAAHYVRAVSQTLAPGRYWQKIGIGRLPVDIEYADFDYSIVMTQATPKFGTPLAHDMRLRVMNALNLGLEDSLLDLPMVRVDTGASKIMVGVKSRDVLNAIRPDNEKLRALAKSLDCKGYFAFTLGDSDPDVHAHCRMFAPQIGIAEDPVTGNGNGPLGAYLVNFGLVDTVEPTVVHRFRQGEAMGRPGTARVWTDHDNGRPTAVRVGGDAVIVYSATMVI